LWGKKPRIKENIYGGRTHTKRDGPIWGESNSGKRVLTVARRTTEQRPADTKTLDVDAAQESIYGGGSLEEAKNEDEKRKYILPGKAPSDSKGWGYERRDPGGVTRNTASRGRNSIPAKRRSGKHLGILGSLVPRQRNVITWTMHQVSAAR